MGFAFASTLFEHFKAAFIRRSDRNRESLRVQIITGVAGSDFYMVGFAAETDNIMREDDFSFCHGAIKSSSYKYMKDQIVSNAKVGKFTLTRVGYPSRSHGGRF